MDRQLREFVRRRAADHCEYCQISQAMSPLAQLQIEHIRPRKHGGGDEEQNLALACIDCNLAKSSNLTGIDPLSGDVTELFNPRSQTWADHFAWQGVLLTGLTPTGRATIRVLNINDEERQRVRLVAGFKNE
jgi:5-methylcytosine-specific restriction endonuclease McrA